MREQPLRLIDLFAGAGGFTRGFIDHFGPRLVPVWANDFDKYAVQTYNANFGNHCIGGDIVDILADPDFVLPQADIVIGGPPCQGFSLLNKRRENDPRKHLWQPYMEVVRRSGAHTFVIENVRQLIKTPEHDAIVETARNMGFRVASEILLAADYGVPQMRFRAFIVGNRFVDPSLYFPPKKTHFNPQTAKTINFLEYADDLHQYQTVRDVIADLPAPVGTEIRKDAPPLDLHFGRQPTALSIKRYQTIPEEGMSRLDLQQRAPEITPDCWIRNTKGGTDIFGRLWWDRPASTIRTNFFKPETGRYLHPTQHRPITHREAARIQSFPDDFVFCGKKIDIARQIGNAVPPLLARHVAAAIESMLKAAVQERACFL